MHGSGPVHGYSPRRTPYRSNGRARFFSIQARRMASSGTHEPETVWSRWDFMSVPSRRSRQLAGDRWLVIGDYSLTRFDCFTWPLFPRKRGMTEAGADDRGPCQRRVRTGSYIKVQHLWCRVGESPHLEVLSQWSILSVSSPLISVVASLGPQPLHTTVVMSVPFCTGGGGRQRTCSGRTSISSSYGSRRWAVPVRPLTVAWWRCGCGSSSKPNWRTLRPPPQSLLLPTFFALKRFLSTGEQFSMGQAPAGADLVSIVLPTRNGARYIERSIDSCAAQTHDNWELIVVDDGSTDETPGILARYAGGRVRVTRPCR